MPTGLFGFPTQFKVKQSYAQDTSDTIDIPYIEFTDFNDGVKDLPSNGVWLILLKGQITTDSTSSSKINGDDIIQRGSFIGSPTFKYSGHTYITGNSFTLTTVNIGILRLDAFRIRPITE